jgi:hypothetical protein
MFQSDKVCVSKMSTGQVDSTTLESPAANRIAATVVTSIVASTARCTKDSGRVHIGGGLMRFDTKDTSRVHIGGGLMRF